MNESVIEGARQHRDAPIRTSEVGWFNHWQAGMVASDREVAKLSPVTGRPLNPQQGERGPNLASSPLEYKNDQPFDAATQAFIDEAAALLSELPDPAVSLCLRWLRLEAEANALAERLDARAEQLATVGVPTEIDPEWVIRHDELEHISAAQDRVRSEIASTPAEAPAGVLAKLTVWQTDRAVPPEGRCDHEFARSAAADLRRLNAAGFVGRAA